jgi:hypothetical protein
MKNEKLMVENSFYQACADLLGVSYDYSPYPFSRRTRWNNRAPGNGRFPDHGLIRMHGPNLINVSLKNPRMSGFYYSVESALDAIKKALKK